MTPEPTSHSEFHLRRTATGEGNADLRRYFGLFLSNWYWFAATFFIAVIIAYGINKYSEKVYTISSTLLINEQGSSDMTGMDKIIPSGDIFRSQQNIQNEIGRLKSYRLNYEVMRQLPEFHITVYERGRRGIAQRKHYKSEPFVVVYDSLKDQQLGIPINIRIKSHETYSIEIAGIGISKSEMHFGERFNEAGFDFSLKLRDPAHFYYNSDFNSRFIIWFNHIEDLANEYRGKLTISPFHEDASLLTLTVSGTVALQEAEYLNKLMEVYRQQGLDDKNETAEKTIKFIDEQLDTISNSLKHAENSLEEFRLSNKMMDLSSEGSAIKTKLENYNQEKITAELQKQYYDYLADYLKTRNETGEILSPSVMGVTDQLLIGLVNGLATLQNQKIQMMYNFSSNQPAINLINTKIEDARAALDENVRNCIINVERVIDDVNSRISLVEKDMNKLPGTEKKLINIQRTYDLNNTVYTYMLEKRSEARISKASSVSNSRIIDPAEPFNASMISPKQRRNYLFAIILGLFIPGLYIYLSDLFHNTIIDKKDIEKGTQVPIIGFVGHNATKNEMPIVTKPGSSLAESFRSIRTNLKYYLNGEKKAVISVTSTISGEGKTFIALNLATVIAMLGKKTLLVGMDLRRPKLDTILASKKETGLSHFLINEASFDDIIIHTEVTNLDFVPTSAIPPNPTELIETQKMKEFMKQAKKEYDFIVLDTPPVGVVSDALLLGAFSDINIFVIRQRFSFKNTLELIQNIYMKKELKNLTIAVNDIHISGYYGYGLRYGYGFYQGYGYNYGYSQYGSYGRGDYHKYYTED
jgi:tyrosine-protein kinase Etk/Wzc